MASNVQRADCIRTDRRTASVAVIAERRYLSHAQPSGMVRALRDLGHTVHVIDPEEMMFEASDCSWMNNIDIAVARGRSWNVFFMLAWLERYSVPVINPRRSIAAVHNKAEMAVALSAAGIPTPRTWIAPPRQLARNLFAADFPVVVKPLFGDNCRGLQVVHSREHLSSLDWQDGLAIVQQFIPGSEFDLKLYCIGSNVFAVRKPSPLTRLEDGFAHHASELLPLQPGWRDLAMRCGRIFGLELYGVDCIETSEGLLVIEVNEFPNYSAVPGADEKLSEYIVACLQQERVS